MTKAVKNKILYNLHFLQSIGYTYHDAIHFPNKEINSSALPNSMEQLQEVVENCYLCELAKSRKNILFGMGNHQASLMFISDEPTASEDELKSFYVGKSGEQLIKMIENVLPFKKEEVYITNLVKCKSSNGISLSQCNSCSAYLYKQIELIQPKLIVTLGEKVFHYLCNDQTPISQARGQLHFYKTFKVLPTYGINFLLRNPSLKKEVYQDMLKIKAIVESN